MNIPIIGDLINLGKTWLEGKNAKSKAKAEAEATVMVKSANSVADWEKVMAVNSGSSWKDEWILILVSIPMIMAFIPGLVEYVRDGFEVLDTMPDWYKYTLSIVVAGSYGIRSATQMFKLNKGLNK